VILDRIFLFFISFYFIEVHYVVLATGYSTTIAADGSIRILSAMAGGFALMFAG